MDTLKRLKLDDNTMVIFTSDNGGIPQFVAPLNGSKGALYEGGIRVPACVNEVEETVDDAVMNESSENNEESEEDEVAVKPHKRKRGKRKPLPQNLERVRQEFDLSDEEKICPDHGTPLVKIGENVTEQLDYIPAKLRVIENVTFTYKCPCCSEENDSEKIIASLPDQQPIPKSFASPSLLAFLVVAKYQDALPLYRVERQFYRMGIELTRTTMARWMIQLANLCLPLWNLMIEQILSSQVVGCDETPVQVLKEEHRTAQQTSYMWVLHNAHGPPIVIFNYQTGRSGKTAGEILGGFEGILLCDGLKSYDSFARKAFITLAACLAHIRRKFYAAEKAAKKNGAKSSQIKASIPLNLIRQLYKIEKEIKGKSPDEILEKRKEESRPIMDQLKSWLDKEVDRVLPKSLLGKAINYSLDQWPKMEVFLSNGLVPVDNNQAERFIRSFVIGRKNWIFSATAKGAEASAILYSLVESAKANKIGPYSYLYSIFKELPKAKGLTDFENLLPHKIAEHYKIEPYRPPK